MLVVHGYNDTVFQLQVNRKKLKIPVAGLTVAATLKRIAGAVELLATSPINELIYCFKPFFTLI